MVMRLTDLPLGLLLRRARATRGSNFGFKPAHEPQGSAAKLEVSDRMSTTSRRMHMGVFVLGTGNHIAGWRYEGAATSHMQLPVIQEIARIAERGKFDLLFISDSMAMDPTDHPSFMCRLEPTTLISVLSASTTRIGLGATVSTSFSEPFNVARMFGSIDHISGGRAAWNVVTSSNPKAAQNFNRDEHLEHELRYQRANEFVDVVRGLWDCWDDDAITADKVSGQYIDEGKVRPLNHKGQFFQVKGPVNMSRCPQGHPVIIQAGGSPSGLELAARTADVVFSVVQDLQAAKIAYADLKARMAKYGRSPNDLAVLPGVMPIIGANVAEAREKLSKLQSWLTPTNAATLVASRIGYEVSGHPLDGPVPPPPPSQGSRTFSHVLYEIALREKMTLRDLYNLTAAARGHWVVCGTPQSIADTLEEWFVEAAADGFNILPPYFPGAFDEFVDLVVPELQRRSLFRCDYHGSTLRDHLGLARVSVPMSKREVVGGG
jgi:FMN-dependent oxidoreductase (nitrilotriacetate monooxygenase family)